MAEKNFRRELEALLNTYSKENRSNTPDFVLAHYLERQLEAFDEAVLAREAWYGESKRPGQPAG